MQVDDERASAAQATFGRLGPSLLQQFSSPLAILDAVIRPLQRVLRRDH